MGLFGGKKDKNKIPNDVSNNFVEESLENESLGNLDVFLDDSFDIAKDFGSGENKTTPMSKSFFEEDVISSTSSSEKQTIDNEINDDFDIASLFGNSDEEILIQKESEKQEEKLEKPLSSTIDNSSKQQMPINKTKGKISFGKNSKPLGKKEEEPRLSLDDIEDIQIEEKKEEDFFSFENVEIQEDNIKEEETYINEDFSNKELSNRDILKIFNPEKSKDHTKIKEAIKKKKEISSRSIFQASKTINLDREEIFKKMEETEIVAQQVMEEKVKRNEFVAIDEFYIPPSDEINEELEEVDNTNKTKDIIEEVKEVSKKEDLEEDIKEENKDLLDDIFSLENKEASSLISSFFKNMKDNEDKKSVNDFDFLDEKAERVSLLDIQEEVLSNIEEIKKEETTLIEEPLASKEESLVKIDIPNEDNIKENAKSTTYFDIEEDFKEEVEDISDEDIILEETSTKKEISSTRSSLDDILSSFVGEKEEKEDLEEDKKEDFIEVSEEKIRIKEEVPTSDLNSLLSNFILENVNKKEDIVESFENKEDVDNVSIFEEPAETQNENEILNPKDNKVEFDVEIDMGEDIVEETPKVEEDILEETHIDTNELSNILHDTKTSSFEEESFLDTKESIDTIIENSNEEELENAMDSVSKDKYNKVKQRRKSLLKTKNLASSINIKQEEKETEEEIKEDDISLIENTLKTQFVAIDESFDDSILKEKEEDFSDLNEQFNPYLNLSEEEKEALRKELEEKRKMALTKKEELLLLEEANEEDVKEEQEEILMIEDKTMVEESLDIMPKEEPKKEDEEFFVTNDFLNYNDKTKKVDKIDVLLKRFKLLEDDINSINYDIIIDYSDFINSYRELRFNYVKQKKQKEAQKKKESLKKMRELEEAKKAREMVEKEDRMNEELMTSYSRRKSTLIGNISENNHERLMRLRTAGRDDSIGDEEDLVFGKYRYKDSELTLSELNRKLPRRALYDEYIDDSYVEPEEDEPININTFSNGAIRPPKRK